MACAKLVVISEGVLGACDEDMVCTTCWQPECRPQAS